MFDYKSNDNAIPEKYARTTLCSYFVCLGIIREIS